MNHPFGSCHSHFQEVANLTEDLQRYRKRARGAKNKPTDLEPEMDVDAMFMEHENPGVNDHSMGGVFVEEYEGAGKQYGVGTTFMREFDDDQYARERVENTYYPFASRDEWELASFLLRSDLSMSSIDSLLSLNLVSHTHHNCSQLLTLSTGKRLKAIIQHSKAATRTC